MRDPIIPEPLLIGYFDYAIFALFLAGNYWVVRRRPSWLRSAWFYLALVLLCGLLLPLLSMVVELERTRRPPGETVDNFELLYTYLRFPLYWTLLLLQLLAALIYGLLRRRSIGRHAPGQPGR